MQKVTRTVRERRMFAGGERVLVAVSGGLDSLCLLDILQLLGPDLGLELAVFHFNHRLRPDAGEDAAFVERVAAHYGVPFFRRAGDVARLTREWGLSPEEGARKARYQAMEEVARGWGAGQAALGHTADDRVETFLLRLLAGAGTRGLGSILPKRDIYVRPLIDTWRRELEESWAPALPFPPHHDTTNLDEDIPRNRVRRRLLPLLEREYNPAVREALLREAELLTEDQALLETLMVERAPSLLERGPEVVTLDLAALEGMGQAQLRRAVQLALEAAGVEAGFQLVEDLIRKVLGGASGAGLDLPGGCRAERSYDRLLISPQVSWQPPLTELLVCGEGEHRWPELGLQLSVRLGEEGTPQRFSEDPWEATLDADSLRFPLVLRAVREGDRFRPLGMEGSQKVQDFMVNAKVARERRRRAAVLESAGRIVWLVGFRIDDRYKVTRETRRTVSIRAANPAGSSGDGDQAGPGGPQRS